MYIRFASLASLIVIGFIAGCVPPANGPADTFGLDFTLPPEASRRGVIVFVVDGVNSETFRRMLDSGQLPEIKKRFADRGLYAPQATANVPSVTLANLISIATGLFPGHHGVTGVNWFDRDRLVWRDYNTIAQKNMLDNDYAAATVYQRLPDRTTMSIFFQPHRGAARWVEDWMSAGPPFFFGWYEFIDRLTLYRFNIAIDIARARKAWPAAIVVYLLAPDYHAYRYGVDSPQYAESLRHTDRQLGRVLADMDRAGLLDKLNLVLTSDHGMCPVSGHLRMDRFLERLGLDVAPEHLWESTPFERRADYYQRFQAVLYGGGDRYCSISLRRPIFADGRCVGFEPWPSRPMSGDLSGYPARGGRSRVDLLDLLVKQEAVDAVAYRIADGCVRVRTREGQVEFRQDDGPRGPISCRPVSGDDPLGYARTIGASLLYGEPLPPRRWLELTADTDFPDLPAQIIAYFRAPRAGDIAVFAKPGYDFRGVHKSGHGGLRAADMHVPLLVVGPGVRPGPIACARTTDVVPTMLDLLGEKIPDDLDGQSLIRQNGEKERNP